MTTPVMASLLASAVGRPGGAALLTTAAVSLAPSSDPRQDCEPADEEAIMADFDYLAAAALFVSVIALWYAVHESRRNNSAVVRVEGFQSHVTQVFGENGDQPFAVFCLSIRNAGVSLHDICVNVVFTIRGDDGGHFSIQLDPMGKGFEGAFARGMHARVGLKSYLNTNWFRYLNQLSDKRRELRKQEARIEVQTQGYLAASFSLASAGDGLRGLWNRLANLISPRKYDKERHVVRSWLRRRATLTETFQLFLERWREVEPDQWPFAKGPPSHIVKALSPTPVAADDAEDNGGARKWQGKGS